MNRKTLKNWISRLLIVLLCLGSVSVFATTTSCIDEKLKGSYDTIVSIQNQLDFLMQSAYVARVNHTDTDGEKRLLSVIPSRVTTLNEEINEYFNGQADSCKKEKAYVLRLCTYFLDGMYQDIQQYISSEDAIIQYTALNHYMKISAILNQLLVDFQAL